MIALVFLVSIAVLEYVLRRPTQAPEHPRHFSVAPDAADTSTSGLFHLGQQLDQYGQGQAPTPATAEPSVSEVSVPNPDVAPKG
jgi:hypothetical protein